MQATPSQPCAPRRWFARVEWDMTYDGTQYYGSLTFVIALAP
jgi:hypothetical protein